MTSISTSPHDPFADMLPPLATEEFEALKADIGVHGVLHPVLVDESGNVIDGRHRLKIDPNAPRRVLAGLSEGEKAAAVFRMNFVRRNLSPSQKDEARRRMKATAESLRREGKTQKQIASLLGVARETVRDWFGGNRSNGESAEPSKPLPDCRVKVAPESKPVIANRIAAGETQSQVAADYGVSQRTISTIVNAEKKTATIKAEREQAAARIKTDCGILHGDFRQAEISPSSVDLIFTDPPYVEGSAGLYNDLGEFAARVLRPGGWLMAYSGQLLLPDAMVAVQQHLTYAWAFACLHAGRETRFRKLRLYNAWKPILAFYKPPLVVDWNWFKDVVSGGQEKGLHEWQQSEGEAAYFIERLSPRYGMVVDPFCGSGTTLAAAKRLGRKWLGVEENLEHVTTARARLTRSAYPAADAI